MTQPPRTTESLSRDNEAIREIMHQIQDRLTVPDRATLALGLVGHLATLMNNRQIEKLLGELKDQAERVQDVPPSRRGERDRDEVERGSRERSSHVGQEGRGAVTEGGGLL
jgi:hypothetical protein